MISKGLRQAYDLQDLAYSMGMALKRQIELGKEGEVEIRRDEYGKPVDPPALAQIIKAWRECQERISFHRRVPAPGSLTHKAPTVRRARTTHASSGPVSLPSLPSLPNNDIVDVSAQVAPDDGAEPPASDAAPSVG